MSGAKERKVTLDEPPEPTREWVDEMEQVCTAVAGRDLTRADWQITSRSAS